MCGVDVLAIDLGSNSISVSTLTNNYRSINSIINDMPLYLNLVNNNIVLLNNKPEEYDESVLLNYKLLFNIDYEELPYYYYYSIHKEYTLEKIYKTFIETIKGLINNINNFTDIIITVPVNFSLKHRKILYKSALSLGFINITFINITSACAYAYYYAKRNIIQSNILIIDLGNTDFNACIIHNDNNILTVKASHCDSTIGYNINYYIISFIIDKIKSYSNQELEINNKKERVRKKEFKTKSLKQRVRTKY